MRLHKCMPTVFCHISVADPEFSPGGAPTPKIAIIFQIFCQKLHENERIWTRGARPWRPPLDPPMYIIIYSNENSIDYIMILVETSCLAHSTMEYLIFGYNTVLSLIFTSAN